MEFSLWDTVFTGRVQVVLPMHLTYSCWVFKSAKHCATYQEYNGEKCWYGLCLHWGGYEGPNVKNARLQALPDMVGTGGSSKKESLKLRSEEWEWYVERNITTVEINTQGFGTGKCMCAWRGMEEASMYGVMVARGRKAEKWGLGENSRSVDHCLVRNFDFVFRAMENQQEILSKHGGVGWGGRRSCSGKMLVEWSSVLEAFWLLHSE